MRICKDRLRISAFEWFVDIIIYRFTFFLSPLLEQRPSPAPRGDESHWPQITRHSPLDYAAGFT